MPAVLTHKAIMLLARQRLDEVRTALNAKQSSGVAMTNIDRRVLQLATEAHRILARAPYPNADFPDEAFMRPFGKDVSKLAVLGSMGPDLTGFSATLAPGQNWVFDTVHKGYPDGNREAVVARTCEFALAMWRRGSTAVRAAVSNATQQKEQLDMVRAYVLGHLAHVAGDVISHPFINDLEWHLGTRAFSKLEHGDGEVSHDALVAQKVFRRQSTREGQAWDAWWPTSQDLPKGFFDAYQEALEDVYRARTSRRTGRFEFEEHLRSLDPPPMNAEFVRDGFSMFRSILNIVYGWGGWSWFGFLTPLAVILMAFPFLGIALPQARQLFVGKSEESDEAQGPFEFLTLGVTLGSFLTLGYGIWLTTLTTHGVKARMVLELVGASVNTVLGIIFLATTSVKGFSLPAKYILLFTVPAVIAVLNIVLAIADFARDGYTRRGAIALFYAAPTLVMLVAALLNWLLFLAARAISSDGTVKWPFALFAIIWVVIVIVFWFLSAFVFLRGLKIPEKPGREAEDPHFVRLFDEATLHRGPSDGAPPEVLERFFPSGRRKLIQLWWEGAGDLFVRVDRYRLVFRFTNEDAAPTQEVPAPIAPMPAVDYVKFLERTVKDPDGDTGKLKGTLVHPEDDYVLPPGATFADHGDGEEKLAGHNSEAAKFKKLGTSQDPGGYVLYHAPQSANAIYFGANGPVANTFAGNDADLRVAEQIDGYTYVYDTVDDDSVNTLMGYAADLAALLSLGAVSHMSTLNPPMDPIFQVFRNWNLDRRRVNEWRMLVAGGARSEKEGAPTRFDESMLRPPDPPTWRAPMDTAAADVIQEAERTALEMGWVPLFREWFDMTRRPTVDSLADERLNPNNPTNRAMTRAMAWLLDMPEPA